METALKQVKAHRKLFENYIFPLILLLFPLIAVNEGIDISDTTYNLTNYEYFSKMDLNWKLSILIPSVFGHLVSLLPFAGSLLGFRIYASLFEGVFSNIIYFVSKKYIPGWMIFIGEIIALSICWCPSVIFYNYMTYFFMSMGIILLLSAINEGDTSKQRNKFMLAGAIFGLNVFVRLPNVMEVLFILILFFASYIEREDIKSVRNKFCYCVAGFVITVLVIMIIICAVYGMASYMDMIEWLSSLSADSNSSHGMASSFSSIMSAYSKTLKEMFMMLLCTILGLIMFMLWRGNEKLYIIKKIVYILGIFVLIKYYFSTGTFTTNYYYYDSMFEVAMMFIIISIVLDILDVLSAIFERLGKGYVFIPGTSGERLLSFTSLLIILITPIGSDNYTFPIINNLFLVAPITLVQIRRVLRRMKKGENIKFRQTFPIRAMVMMVLVVLLIQGTFFKFGFSFVDGADGTVRDSTVSIDKAKYMTTTTVNATHIENIYDAILANGMENYKLFVFGNAPGLSFIYDMEPAIYTSWPSLESNRVSDVDEGLMNMDRDTVIIMEKKDESTKTTSFSQKEDIILDYIAESDYNIIFEDDLYKVFGPEKN